LINTFSTSQASTAKHSNCIHNTVQFRYNFLAENIEAAYFLQGNQQQQIKELHV
jgi:hypothetical protein